MLWLMRRRWIRRLQRGMIGAVPPAARPKFHAMFLAQERFARRHGLRTLTLVVGLFFVSVAFTFVYAGMTEVFNRGWISIPTNQEELASEPAPVKAPKPLHTGPATGDGEPIPARPTAMVPAEN